MSTAPAHTAQRWLFHRSVDIGWLLVPVWACWALCFALPEAVLGAEVPLWLWVVVVLGIDVAHVWSTLFRTYLDPDEFSRHRQLLLLAPLVLFVLFLGVASYSEPWFWRVMAYLALYHFMKQQYGFLALYRARYGKRVAKRWFRDKWVMYAAMIYPVLYWHLTPGRAFSWFVEGDFFSWHWETVALVFQWGHLAYALMLLGWLWEELRLTRQHGWPIAWGKVLWMLTTAGNWFLGIVYFNSDLAFTLTNVVAHGIPYVTLVAIYVSRKRQAAAPLLSRARPPWRLIAGMVAGILLLALAEEYLWDMLLNREKHAFFAAWFDYPIAVVRN
ncbi:MAG: hypothetical protein AAGB22_00310, partial [Bacteroidota bacterium]